MLLDLNIGFMRGQRQLEISLASESTFAVSRLA